MIEGVHYYIDPKGKWVFTAAYHEGRGYCCGEACKHCPFDYDAVPEPIKTRAQLIRAGASKLHQKATLKNKLTQRILKSIYNSCNTHPRPKTFFKTYLM